MRNGMMVLLVLFSWWVVPALAVAWDWPVKDPVLAVDFAADWNGSFLPGVFIKSSDALVRSIHGGELVFFADGPRQDHRGFPGTAGGTLVIQHDSGLRSVYRGLKADSARDFAAKIFPADYKVKQNEIIGVMPLRGDSAPKNLFFQVVDTSFGGALNPMIILPRLFDERPPAITAVEYSQEGDPVRRPLKDRMELDLASIQLFIQVRDGYGQKGNRPASTVGLPQDIRVFLNGSQKYRSYKQALYMKKGNPRELRLSKVPDGGFAIMHAADNMIPVGELTLQDGMNRLEVRVTDLEGNHSSASYRINKPVKPAPP